MGAARCLGGGALRKTDLASGGHVTCIGPEGVLTWKAMPGPTPAGTVACICCILGANHEAARALANKCLSPIAAPANLETSRES